MRLTAEHLHQEALLLRQEADAVEAAAVTLQGLREPVQPQEDAVRAAVAPPATDRPPVSLFVCPLGEDGESTKGAASAWGLLCRIPRKDRPGTYAVSVWGTPDDGYASLEEAEAAFNVARVMFGMWDPRTNEAAPGWAERGGALCMERGQA